MRYRMPQNVPFHVAPLAGSVDRNLFRSNSYLAWQKSLPSRGAWIEIQRFPAAFLAEIVAPLAGSVDRNHCNTKVVVDAMGRSPRGERG